MEKDFTNDYTPQSKHSHDTATSYLFYQNMRKHRLLTAEEEKLYGAQARKGVKEARDKMMNCNQRLVAKIAAKYLGRGIDFSDLTSEGNLGLLKAISMFDPEKGFRFSTYATWWIKQTIERSIMKNSRAIRIPTHALKKISCYLQAANKLNKSLQRTATLEEIAEFLGWKVETVAKMALLNDGTISIDTPIYSDNEVKTFYNTLKSTDVPSPEDEEMTSNIKKIVYSSFKCLNKREQKLIKERFGILGDNGKNLRETGEIYGVYREAIRRTQLAIFDKLRDFFDKHGIKATDIF